MPLTLIGLSHHTAPLEVRERFAAEVQAGRHSIAGLRDLRGLREIVLLSTCNRTEQYLVTEHELDHSALLALLPQPPGIDPGQLSSYTYVRHEHAAVEHLFRVVSSLDSMMLGEAQIQGQVRSAYESALALQREHKVVGPILSRLFENALGVGARVRAETRLGDGAASIPSAAVELAGKIFGALRGRHALVLGTGEMSELAVECLSSQGTRTSVVSRTVGRARELASRAQNGAAASVDELTALLPTADIVVSATSAPHAVITRAMLERALPKGAQQPLLIVDLALPRDVEPDVGEMRNVFLYNLDDLHQVIEGTLERRRAELPFAEAIIRDGATEYWNWYRALEVVPVIRELRERAERLRAQETERALRGLPHLAPEDRAAVDALTRQLLAKLLHQPTVKLREAAATGQNAEIVEAARFLFELENRNGGEENA
jgi:glutamyl-tRNA reductase